jgi:hypothetical protein
MTAQNPVVLEPSAQGVVDATSNFAGPRFSVRYRMARPRGALGRRAVVRPARASRTGQASARRAFTSFDGTYTESLTLAEGVRRDGFRRVPHAGSAAYPDLC